MPAALTIGAIPVRDLKRVLRAAGISVSGVVEKSELVHLLANSLASLSVKELKRLLNAAGGSHTGLLEKAELVQLLRHACAISPGSSSTRQSLSDYDSLSIKDLKRLLHAAGVSSAGATERSELIRLLRRARARASLPVFEASWVWKEVPPGTALPSGLEVRFDIRTGKNYARRLQSPLKAVPAGRHTKPRDVKNKATYDVMRNARRAPSPSKVAQTRQGLLAIQDAAHGPLLAILDGSAYEKQARRRVTGKRASSSTGMRKPKQDKRPVKTTERKVEGVSMKRKRA